MKDKRKHDVSMILAMEIGIAGTMSPFEMATKIVQRREDPKYKAERMRKAEEKRAMRAIKRLSHERFSG